MSPPDGTKLPCRRPRPEPDPSSDGQRVRDEAGMHLAVQRARSDWLMDKAPVGAEILRDVNDGIGAQRSKHVVFVAPDRKADARRLASKLDPGRSGPSANEAPPQTDEWYGCAVTPRWGAAV